MPQELRPKKLLEQMRDVLRTQHYAIRTEHAYVDWARDLALQKTVVTMCGVLLPLERLQVFNEDKEIPADHLLAD